MKLDEGHYQEKDGDKEEYSIAGVRNRVTS